MPVFIKCSDGKWAALKFSSQLHNTNTCVHLPNHCIIDLTQNLGWIEAYLDSIRKHGRPTIAPNLFWQLWHVYFYVTYLWELTTIHFQSFLFFLLWQLHLSEETAGLGYEMSTVTVFGRGKYNSLHIQCSSNTFPLSKTMKHLACDSDNPISWLVESIGWHPIFYATVYRSRYRWMCQECSAHVYPVIELNHNLTQLDSIWSDWSHSSGNVFTSWMLYVQTEANKQIQHQHTCTYTYIRTTS